MNEDRGGNGGGSPRAPQDDPALYACLRQEQERNRYRDGSQRATSSKTPEALDLRLLTPVLACWVGAGRAVGHGVADTWGQVLLLTSECTALAVLLVVAILCFRPPCHRADPRPGTPEYDPGAMGTLSAGLLVRALYAAAILTISAVRLQAHQRNPLTAAVTSRWLVTLIGTASRQLRVSATSRSTLIITTLGVAQADMQVSTLSTTVPGDMQWLSLPMGIRVRVHTRLRPTEARRVEAVIIPKHAGLAVLGPPSGVFGAVISVRTGLVRVVGAPGIGAPGVVGAGEETGL